MFRISRVAANNFKLPHSKFFPTKTSPALPNDSYQDKVVFCTGGGTGLGKAMTTRMCEHGATAVIVSRKMPVLEATAKEINDKLGRQAVVPMQLDVRDVDSIISTFDNIERQLGVAAPDVVINNAAGNFISPTERLSHNAVNTVLDIVLKGTASITLEAGKRMIKNERGGTFLAITTPYATYGTGFTVPSAAAKAGVEALAKSLSAEWGRYGIRMNVIAPGGIYTEGAFSRLDPNGTTFKKMVEKTPAGRAGVPEEIANLAAYLCSDYASWLSGEVITFDGANIRQVSGIMNDLLKVPQEEWDQIEKAIRTKAKSS